MSVIGAGEAGEVLSQDKTAEIVAQAAEAIAPAGRKILVVIPDHTRTCPLPQISRLLHRAMASKAASSPADAQRSFPAARCSTTNGRTRRRWRKSAR